MESVPKVTTEEEEIFVEGIMQLMKTYMEESSGKIASRAYLSPTAAGILFKNVESVFRDMLSTFFQMSQKDAQISMYMIPVMAYIRKARKVAGK